MKTDTRDKIIKAATKLFWEKSYTAVSVDTICKAANIKKGSFYHFFPSKDDLMTTVLDTLWQQHKDLFIKPCFDRSFAPLERFNRLANTIGDTACKIKKEAGAFLGCPFGNLAVELSTQNETVRIKLDEIFTEYSTMFRASLDEAVNLGQLPDNTNTDTLAQLLSSCLQGGVLIAKTKNQPEILRSLFKTLLNAIFEQPKKSFDYAA